MRKNKSGGSDFGIDFIVCSERGQGVCIESIDREERTINGVAYN